MLAVPIPKDITDYEEKFMFGLTVRQCVCSVLGGAVAVGLYFLLTKLVGIPSEIAGYIVIIAAAPILAIGFIKKDNMPFEAYASIILRHYFTSLNKVTWEAESSDFGSFIQKGPVNHVQKKRHKGTGKDEEHEWRDYALIANSTRRRPSHRQKRIARGKTRGTGHKD